MVTLPIWYNNNYKFNDMKKLISFFVGFFLFVLFCFVLFGLFRATLMAHGSSQARG